MNEVIVNSTARLKAEDAQAMAVYVKSLTAVEDAASGVSTERTLAGAGIYEERCQKCHMASGRGGLFAGPSLVGSAIVQADNPASLINVILHGPQLPKEITFGTWETMHPYADVLDDAQVASMCNFVRGSWGNRAATVLAEDVVRQR
jgi:mono/diheme cytochrome c family protein